MDRDIPPKKQKPPKDHIDPKEAIFSTPFHHRVLQKVHNVECYVFRILK